MPRYEINKQKIGKKIKKIRGEYSMSEFAFRIRVAKSTIGNYETGRILTSRKIIKRIIAVSDNPTQTVDEFLYGTPAEYIRDIFSSVASLRPSYFEEERAIFINNGVADVIYNKLECMLKSGKITYGYEKEIVEYALHINEDLKNNPDFLRLWMDYGFPPFKRDLFIVEAKDWDCYESFVVLAENKEHARILALEYLDKEIEKWRLKDNFRKYGLIVKKIDMIQAKVIHTSFRSG